MGLALECIKAADWMLASVTRGEGVDMTQVVITNADRL